MGLRCIAASSTRIFNAAPVLSSTGYPFTVGMWFKTIAFNGTIFSYADTAVANNYFYLGVTGAPQLVWGASTAAGEAQTVSAITPVNGRWDFALARNISATNRWLSHMAGPGGQISTVQNATSRAPTSLDNLTLGAFTASTVSSFFDGIVAEFWYLDADIKADPAVALPNDLVKELAHRGPLALPSLDNLVEWRGLRTTVGFDTDDPTDVYARVGRQTWQQSATKPILADHPPLGPNYLRPGQTKRVLVA